MAEKLIFEIEIDGGKSVQSLAQLKEELKRLKTEFSQAKFGTPEFSQLGEVIKKVEKESKDLTNSFKEQNTIVPGSVANIRLELKQFQQALENSIPGTKEFDFNLKQVGQRKNELLELKQAIKATTGDFDSNLKAFASLAQGLAGGFTVATSAMALFGDENEELAKAVQKAQLAMSLLQGIESLAGSKDAANIVRRILFFKDYKKSIDDATSSTNKNTVATELGDKATKASVISFQALKTAIIATGIGLLVVAVSELVANWDKVKETFSSTFPIFQKLGEWVDETKQRFVGAFYAISESIKPVGQFIYDYFTTPFQVAFQSAKILFDVLKNPLSLDNLKKGVSEFGTLFKDTKDKLVGDVKDIQNKFNEGFEFGVILSKTRQNEEKNKEIIEKEIKNLELSVQKIESGSLKRLKVEEDIIQKKILIAKKGSDEYNQLEIELFTKQEEIKNKNEEIRKKNVEEREKQFSETEKQIKEKYSQQSTVINVTAQIKVNEGANPAEIESIRDIQLTQNKIIELEVRKTLYEKYKKDVTSILDEITSTEQTLIEQNKSLVESLKTQEFNQDNTNLESYISERENIINQNYLTELTALQSKNLSVEELEKQTIALQSTKETQLSDLKKEGLQKQLQNAKDYGQSTVQINKQILDNDIANTENALNKKLELEKEFNAKKLELSRELVQKQQELESEALNAVFQLTSQINQEQATTKIQNVEENLTREQTLIDENIKKGIITQEQGEKQKQAATQKSEKEKRKIIRETAIAERVINLFKIGVDTARAVNAITLQASILASNPATLALAPMALAQIPIAIGSAAIQSGLILASPLPAAQKGTIIGGPTPTLQKGSKPVMVMGGIVNRFEQGGMVDYAIVNQMKSNSNTQSNNSNISKYFGQTPKFEKGGTVTNSNSELTSIINNSGIGKMLGYTSTNNYVDGGIVTNTQNSSLSQLNTRNSSSTLSQFENGGISESGLIHNHLLNSNLSQFEMGGIPQIIDMGNGNFTLFDSNVQTSTNVSSRTNPLINIGGRYTDDVLAVNDQNQPIARVNKGEAIISAGAMSIPGVPKLLSDINILGGGARFPGFIEGGVLSNLTNTTNNNNGGSLMNFDTAKLELLLSEIKSEVARPQRSYVVESDISEAQQRISTIRDRASF